MTDCNKIQANNLACNKISLTEQWDKGELPNGYYYCKLIINNMKPSIERCKAHCIPMGVSADRGEEVLAPVPSYEEYLSLTYAKEEDEGIIAEYEIENTKLKEELKDYEYQHKQDGICYDDIFCKLELARKENRQLKTDCKALSQKLLQVKPELRDWLEVNYGEYL